MILRNNFLTPLVLAVLLALSSLPSASAASLFGSKKKPLDPEMQPRKLTAAQSALVDQAVLHEKDVIRALRERTPLVETYIQTMRPDAVLGQAPDSDQHFLGRVEFSRIIDGNPYRVNKSVATGRGKVANASNSMTGFFKSPQSFLTAISGPLRLSFQENGFMQMLLIDSNDFDRNHYVFNYIRTEFLGNTPTAIFDVSPADPRHDTGRFLGRVWIETRSGNVVRFDGEFTGSENGVAEYYHFDSWRTNVQPGLWLPTSFYVEESDDKSNLRTLKFKAISHIWGYQLKAPSSESENTSMEVVGATDVSNEAQDVSPLGAQRAWEDQAEQNVLTRLFQAGLLDAPSEFDKTLEALANNILAYNNITLARPIHCRTLLTEPLESLAIGNTIVISKGLLDTTAILSQDGAQQMGNLNAILAFQLAHIIMGHHIDTQYAFNDRLLFPSTMVFNRVPMNHNAADNEAAAKKALVLLSAKELEGGQQYFGLYLQQLNERMKPLKALNQPLIGDGLTKSETDSTFWLAALMPKAPKLDLADLRQQAAMPLSNFLRLDPWTDQVIVLHSGYEPLINPADKMPFEVTPVYIKLSYYKPEAVADTAPAANGANGANGTSAQASQAQPAADTPADTNGAAAPQQPAATDPSASEPADPTPNQNQTPPRN